MDIIQIVIQAGAVGIAVYAIFVLQKLVGNHINHSTEAMQNLSKVIGELGQIIKDRMK